MVTMSFVMLACHGNIGSPGATPSDSPAAPTPGPTPAPAPFDCKETRRCSDELRNLDENTVMEIWREIRNGQPFDDRNGDRNGADMRSLAWEEKLALAGARLRAVLLKTAVDGGRGHRIGSFENGSFLKLFWSFFDENGDLREPIDPKEIIRLL